MPNRCSLLELKGHGRSRSVASARRHVHRQRQLGPDRKVWYARTGQESIELPPDAGTAYRRLHTQPNLGRYREVTRRRAARTTSRPGSTSTSSRRANRRCWHSRPSRSETAAGRTQDALVHLVSLSAANPEDTILSLRVAALQAGSDETRNLPKPVRVPSNTRRTRPFPPRRNATSLQPAHAGQQPGIRARARATR